MPFEKGKTHGGGRKKKKEKEKGMPMNDLSPLDPGISDVATPLEPVTEKIPKRREIPVFDHGKETIVSVSATHRYLEQDGNLFTFAEWNREQQRYLPEPRYVPRGTVGSDELMGRITQYLFKMSELEMSLRNFQEVLLRNLEIMRDG